MAAPHALSAVASPFKDAPLMMPKQGPRVRIGVVTTDLPLIPDRSQRDPSAVVFCRHCLKCAENCPSSSIPFDDRQEIDGVKRWRIYLDT